MTKRDVQKELERSIAAIKINDGRLFDIEMLAHRLGIKLRPLAIARHRNRIQSENAKPIECPF